MQTRITSTLALLVLAAPACDRGVDDFGGADPANLSAPVGKADGPELSVDFGGAFDVVNVRGDAAVDLFTAMDRAGGFSTLTRGGVAYRYGFYTICASNSVAAACRLYAHAATQGATEDFLGTVHGPRFDSAASEMFSALTRAQGVAPSSVATIASERWFCGKDSSEVWCGLLPPPTAQTVSLSLAFAGLPALGSQFVYEGWLITPDGPVTSGRFDAPAEGQTVSSVIPADVAAVTSKFVLTIEPRVGDDPAPAATHIVAGDFLGATAELTTGDPAAIGSDFDEAAGDFILETPSSGAVAADYRQGIWFLDPSGPAASLRLPELPGGWAYEGWVVTAEGPISTGRFTDPAAADDDLGGPAAGPDPTPPFPGQDFVSPALDLVGATVVISVEPEPDDGPAPFALKPLVTTVIDAGAGALQSLGNEAAASRISGVAAFGD